MDDSPKKLQEQIDTEDTSLSFNEIDKEIDKVNQRLFKIKAELKKNLINFKNSKGQTKSKWKKEAAFYLKKKKFYEDYIERLNNTKYEKEMRNLQKDIDAAKAEFEKLSKEFYENLSYLYQQNEEFSDDEEELINYELEMNEDTLNHEFDKILPELNEYSRNLDITKYLKGEDVEMENNK